MKALTLTGVKQFALIEKDLPKAEGNKVVIKISKSGICGSDYLLQLVRKLWEQQG